MLTHTEWVCSYSPPFADLLLAQQIVEVFLCYIKCVILSKTKHFEVKLFKIIFTRQLSDSVL